ncbi:MAG: hypothetical protein NPINA01_22450 [Nitrospinaceae bacterium]|nr:MAG: hypothetical protein NPINA01_22450 [Nitrospinaceae bacterium]
MLSVALSRRNLNLIPVVAMVAAVLVLTFSTPGYGIPKSEPFLKLDKQGADQQELGYQPMHEIQPPANPSLHPNLTPFINEAHPFPDYIKKFNRGGQFPKHYIELLKTAPVDQVQSKVFNISAFQNARKIGVADFENKTAEPFKDKDAGYVVASQVSRELQSYRKYQVIPPTKTSEDARLKITAAPPATLQDGNAPSLGEDKDTTSVEALPYAKQKVDAVLIGAVTKYMDSYIDRRGEMKKSISSGVEFGAFLINAKTGEVIWGARFVGTQTPNIRGLFEGRTHWLNKEEFSRAAMKKVLKAFNETKQ